MKVIKEWIKKQWENNYVKEIAVMSGVILILILAIFVAFQSGCK